MPYQPRLYYEEQGRLLLEGNQQIYTNTDAVRAMVLKMFNNLRPGFLLNIGIGPMPLVDVELLKRGFSIVGIDISYSFLALARKALNQEGFSSHLIVSDATNLPFPQEAFNFCLCSEVIEHVREPESLFKEINRVLKPGGKLILTTPNRLSLGRTIVIVRSMLKQEKFISHDAHVKEYMYYEMSKICQKFFKLKALYYTEAFTISKDVSFFKAPFGKICNFIVSFLFFNRLANTLGFVLEKPF